MTTSKFVIVKHDAKRAKLHYDLRFIMPKSKIWASFAVRKGVPTEPGTKVLAVRTHDHTEKEALFFGTIKQGYGAGRLTKWDDGQCIIHKYSPGHIAIEFKGRKVKGLYHMVSTGVMNKKDFKKKSYMLFKGKEALKEWTGMLAATWSQREAGPDYNDNAKQLPWSSRLSGVSDDTPVGKKLSWSEKIYDVSDGDPVKEKLPWSKKLYKI